ncbi:hypothetical protein M2444_006127 [Paenibacillus sp. PastF-3]|uniref:hypothetical protein n=1 Tax=Paenibacillus sp. PastF-3 TaxID=2940626 RepID=UPI0024756676|nr:hypothetical protein [Paenibacillus sp. PastF-3]MDH6374277.1 hypothetical protein [Paenibacillus sp. PastF-3]
MTKNKKVAITCVSVLFILIAAVLLIRSPSKLDNSASDPPAISTKTKPLPTPTVTEHPTTPSDSHEKVAEIIDYSSNAIVNEIPGLWARIQDSWRWLMVLDTKHALILVFVVIFIISLCFGKKNKKSS